MPAHGTGPGRQGHMLASGCVESELFMTSVPGQVAYPVQTTLSSSGTKVY